MKPWLNEPRGRQLEAFLGVWGIKTSNIETTNDLLADACTLYGIDIRVGQTVETVADEINALGRKGRKARVEQNIGFFTDRQPTSSKTEQPITEEGLNKMMADSSSVMIDGKPFGVEGELDIDPAKLLRKVVSAVISAGQGHVLYEFPEVLAFFNARMPAHSETAA